jgi:hypothetical protein
LAAVANSGARTSNSATELVAIRGRLQAGSEVASQPTEAEWTAAGRDATARYSRAALSAAHSTDHDVLTKPPQPEEHK